MHLHGNSMNLNLLTSVYSAAAGEKLANAKQAAETRRKLLSAASRMEGEQADDAIVTLGEQPDEDSRQHQNPKDPLNPKAKQTAAANGDADGVPPDDPISTWA
jgi:hypothetical protein